MSKDRAKGKGGGLLDIEDMGITFDDEGQIINVVKVEADKLIDPQRTHKVHQQVKEDKTIVP